MGPITSILPRPRKLTLAGVEFLVGELTLDDVADLQDYLDRGHPDPREGLRAKVEELAGKERREVLMEAYYKAEEGPPCWGQERGMRVFMTDDGFAELVFVALRRHHPEISRELARRIGMVVMGSLPDSLADYDRLMGALIRIGPAEEIGRMLGLVPDEGGTPITWGEAVVEVATMLGRLPSELGPMTLSQFRAMRRGGKPKAVGIPLAPGKGLQARWAAAMETHFGEGNGEGA